jgi:hypothetical protein
VPKVFVQLDETVFPQPPFDLNIIIIGLLTIESDPGIVFFFTQYSEKNHRRSLPNQEMAPVV